MVGTQVSFWDGLFAGAVLVSGSVAVFEGMILPSYMRNLMQVSIFAKDNKSWKCVFVVQQFGDEAADI